MAGKLERFRNLEQARKPDDTPARGVISKERFSGTPPPLPDAADDAFRAEREEQLRSGIEIETAQPAEQPFLRCPVCEADNSKYAMRCLNCQARLDTDEVHEWNARLWAERQKQKAAEPPPPAPEAVDQKRLLGEAIARQVGERERSRMWWSGDSHYDNTPLGMRLLEMIPDPNVRFGVSMALVGAFFGSGLVAFVARHHPALQAAGTIVAVALLVLFMPNRRRHRHRHWWNWLDDD